MSRNGNTTREVGANEDVSIGQHRRTFVAKAEQISNMEERSRSSNSITRPSFGRILRKNSVTFDAATAAQEKKVNQDEIELEKNKSSSMRSKSSLDSAKSSSMRKSSLDLTNSSHDDRDINDFSKTFKRYIKKKKSYPGSKNSIDTSSHSLLNNMEEKEKSQRGLSFLQTTGNSSRTRISSIESIESTHLESLQDAKTILKSVWNIDFEEYNFKIGEPFTQVKIQEKKDAVLLMESWNKVLAFRSMFAEALIGRWRILVAADEISDKNDERRTDFEQQFWVQNIIETSDNAYVSNKKRLENEAVRLVENNLDTLALHFGERVADMGLILVSMIDMAVRSLCPHSQFVQREAYREMKGSADDDIDVSDLFFHEKECTNFEGFCKLFSSYGIRSEHWLLLCDAFLLAMKNQTPYSLDYEKDSMTTLGAHGKFISGMVVLPLIEAMGRRSIYIQGRAFTDLKDIISIDDNDVEDNIQLVATAAFSKLFSKLPHIEDHFSDIDIQEVSYYIFEM